MTAAYKGLGVSIATTYNGNRAGEFSFTPASVADPNATATTAQGAHLTTLNSAIATAVADGASPTQAHVTAINNAWTNTKADINAVVVQTADVILLYSGAITTKAQARAAIRALLQLVESDGSLT